MEITLTNELVTQLTGAPISALEKKSLDNYQHNQSNKNDIYVEGVIVSAGSWLDGFRGFFSPANLREGLEQVGDGDINLFIDSPGGSVFGSANMISQLIKLKKEGRKINSVITGLCASAATYFLFESDTTAISQSGMVMVHRSSAIGMGDYKDLRKMSRVLEKLDNQYVQQLVSLTGKSSEDVESAVDDETWFTSKEAIDYGLVKSLYKSSKDDDAVKQKNQFRMLINQLTEFNF